MEEKDKAGPARNTDVINCLYQIPNAIFKLICFPWAGGGSIHFAKWGQMNPELLEVHSIRLAGRESRILEPFAEDIQQVVEEIAQALLPILQDKPFAFFGHSMGSYIAFLTALYLKEKHKLEPIHLFLSSSTPPHSKLRFRVKNLKDASEGDVASVLDVFGGTSGEFINDEEFLQQYRPKLLADIHLINNYEFVPSSKKVLSCDLTCFVGSDDIVNDIEAWKDLTRGNLDIQVCSGNHFYLFEPTNEAFIQQYIIKHLELSMLAGF
ncbi:S-acyl fatty acid synthase thioesterase, medium chain [Suncus etruscus]|uniref:S-acyl fatty acid synthase thioesterase, medium chain n=1 Tax=Suncus etruscus TaxID=109475 RepID=UPI00210F6903|nr:S-acyl fatty acid synthase thioesterase, medium chain [Suncus etruscus]